MVCTANISLLRCPGLGEVALYRLWSVHLATVYALGAYARICALTA